MNNSDSFQEKDLFDLTIIIKQVLKSKWFIAKCMIVSSFIGIIIALTSPEEFNVSSTLMTENVSDDSKLSGSLGGLASLAGVDLNGLSGNNGINPGLYRSISESTPFLIELMYQEFLFSEVQENISLYDYYWEHQNTSLFSKILSIPLKILSLLRNKKDKLEISSSTILSLTKEEEIVARDLMNRITVTMDWELDLVIIESLMQDPLVAAKVNEFTMNYITEYATDYITSKNRRQLKFIEEQYSRKKFEFEKIQLKLARFRDQNLNIRTSQGQSLEKQLESEYNLSFNIYNQLAQQLETIKLKMSEETPIFTILEPVKIPTEKSQPRRIFIIGFFIGLGFMVGFLYTLLKSISW